MSPLADRTRTRRAATALRRIKAPRAASAPVLRMRSKRFSFLVLLLLALAPSAPLRSAIGGQERASAASGSVSVYLFWTETCPHCAKAKRFLEALAQREPGIDLHSLELSSDERNEQAFVALSQHVKVDPPAVPLIMIGQEPVVGYDEDATSGAEIEARIEACRSKACFNIAAEFLRGAGSTATADRARDGMRSETEARRPALPETITLPGIGGITVRSLSLPVLTLVLGAVDGFNPCAMWVLVFLIGLLIGMQDPFRMWSYGAVFLLTSAAVYFAFMAAWLNVFLFLGTLSWIRAGIGAFAVGAGAYFLWQFATSADATCAIASPGERQRVTTRLKAAVSERSFVLAVLGLVVLAVGVNLVELLCSAGVPAVYTQVLALSDLLPIEYYAYLTLYIAVFLLDDVIVFVTAMVTLRAVGLTASYTHYSHLIGGVVLGCIGILLLFKPGWLSFT